MAPSSAQAARLTLVIWGTLEILLFAGLIFGWASLVYVFKAEGYFSDLCINGHPVVDNKSQGLGLLINQVNINVTTPTLSGAGESYTALPADSSGFTRTDSNESLAWEPATCKVQDEQFNLIYTLAVVITGVSLFATGWMFDKWGTRVCRIIGITTYLIGTFMTAFATPASALLLYPGIILLVFGGYFFIMTNFQLGNLIPSKRSTIISLYCGAYDSSAFMLVLVKFAYEAGISTKASFLFLSMMLSMVIVSTFWFMPRGRIPYPLPSGYKVDFSLPCVGVTPGTLPDSHQKKASKDSNDDDDMEKDTENDRSDMPLAPVVEEVPTFCQIVKSPMYILDVFWLTCHRFASWSFVGRLNPALVRLAGGNKAIVSRYTSVYASIQFFGIFIAPLSGRLMDRKKSGGTQSRADKVEMCMASFILDSTVGLCLAVTTCIPILEVQYASFALHVIHRACLYGPNSAFIAQAFPAPHFGKLFGFAMSFAGAFSLLQYPLFLIIQSFLDGDPLMANLFTLFLMLISYAHPVYIWYWCGQQRQNQPKQPGAIYIPAKKKHESEPLNKPCEKL